MSTFWTQVDVAVDAWQARFFMEDDGGRDALVVAVRQEGWLAWQAPVPALIARLGFVRNVAFFDLGAQAGYHSLLAAACGAEHVWASEPDPDLRRRLERHALESGLSSRLTLVDPQELFSSLDSTATERSALLRLSAQGQESLANPGIVDLIERSRPVLLVEAPLVSGTTSLERLRRVGGYVCCELQATRPVGVMTTPMNPESDAVAWLLMPRERAEALAADLSGSPSALNSPAAPTTRTTR